MSQPVATGLTYEDWLELPESLLHHDLIDGQLFVTPPPGDRHQSAQAQLMMLLALHAREHGGLTLAGPYDVRIPGGNIQQPDVLYARAEIVHDDPPYLRGRAPHLVVEVSSPSTRGRDLVVKRDGYARAGVEEYWFVDLPNDEVLVHLLASDLQSYLDPVHVGRGATLHATAAPGFAAPVDELLGRR